VHIVYVYHVGKRLQNNLENVIQSSVLIAVTTSVYLSESIFIVAQIFELNDSRKA